MILATLAIFGIILAGSDGPLFPWLNMAGALMAAISLQLGGNNLQRRIPHER